MITRAALCTCVGSLVGALALALATACDRMFPYAPRRPDLPADRLVAADRSPRDMRGDRVADGVRTDRADLARWPDLARDAPARWPDGTACTTWAAWSCPSFAWYYCKAFCGSVAISCDTVSCTCASGGIVKDCANTSPSYCAGCQDALESGCCQ